MWQWALGGSLGVTLAFVILTIAVYKPRAVGLGLLFLYLIAAYFLACGIYWVKNDFYLPRGFTYSLSVLFALVTAAGVAVGVLGRRVFLGFSIAWGCVFLMLFALSLSRHLRFRHHAGHRQYSKYVFPVSGGLCACCAGARGVLSSSTQVFVYNRRSDTVEISNADVLVVYACLLVGTEAPRTAPIRL